MLSHYLPISINNIYMIGEQEIKIAKSVTIHLGTIYILLSAGYLNERDIEIVMRLTS